MLVATVHCRVLEYRYLQFVSEVTRDIMSRSVLSQPALDLLCQMHIDKHKHSLREASGVARTLVAVGILAYFYAG